MVSIKSFFSSPAIQPVIFFVLLVPLMLSIYAPSFSGGFYLDSKSYILQSHYFQGGLSFPEAIERVVERGYHPASRRIIPNITMAFQTHSNGPIASRLRAFNVIVHAANIVLLFIFINFLTGLLLPNARTKISMGCSLAAALLWGLNPFQVETVAYIVQRSVLLVTFFYLLGAIIFLYITTRSTPGKISWMWFLLILVLSIAALCKENSVQFIITFFLIYLYLLTPQNGTRLNRFIVLPLLGTVFLMIFIMLTARGISGNLLSAYSVRTYTPVERLLTESRVVLHQLSLFTFPLPGRLSLTPHYDLSRSLIMPPVTLLSIMAIVSAIVVIFAFRKKFTVLGVALIWLFSNHLVESTIIPLAIAFPHRTYLPSALMFLIPLVAANSMIFHKQSNRSYIGSGVVLLILMLMAFGTYQHAKTWGNEKEFWLQNIRVSPKSTLPYISLSGYLLENKQSEFSLRVIEKGLKTGDFDNDRPERKGNLLVNRGIALSNLGQFTEGIHWIKEALKLHPGNLQYQYNLAVLLNQSYRWDEAEKVFQELLHSDSSYPDANIQLALIYERKGHFQEALVLTKKEISLFPGNQAAQSLYRRILRKLSISEQ